jgi:hypothetical protein
VNGGASPVLDHIVDYNFPAEQFFLVELSGILHYLFINFLLIDFFTFDLLLSVCLFNLFEVSGLGVGIKIFIVLGRQHLDDILDDFILLFFFQRWLIVAEEKLPQF